MKHEWIGIEQWGPITNCTIYDNNMYCRGSHNHPRDAPLHETLQVSLPDYRVAGAQIDDLKKLTRIQRALWPMMLISSSTAYGARAP